MTSVRFSRGYLPVWRDVCGASFGRAAIRSGPGVACCGAVFVGKILGVSFVFLSFSWSLGSVHGKGTVAPTCSDSWRYYDRLGSRTTMLLFFCAVTLWPAAGGDDVFRFWCGEKGGQLCTE